MKDIGLEWNSKICSILLFKRELMMKDSQGFKLDGSTVIAALEEGTCCIWVS